MKKLLALLALVPSLGFSQVVVNTGNHRGVVIAPSSSLVAGMKLWYEADCITFVGSVCGVPSTGTNITTWADQSGNANTATVFSGTCTFNTAQVNSKPAVTFSSCGLNLASTIAASNGHSAFVVFETTATSSSNNHFIASATGGFEYQLASTSSAQNLTRAALSTVGTATNFVSSGTWMQSNVTMTNAASVFAVAFRASSATDTLVSSSSSSITAAGPKSIGCYVVAGGCTAVFQGKVVAIVYYDFTLTLTQIQQNEAYFRAKYGIS